MKDDLTKVYVAKRAIHLIFIEYVVINFPFTIIWKIINIVPQGNGI